MSSNTMQAFVGSQLAGTGCASQGSTHTIQRAGTSNHLETLIASLPVETMELTDKSVANLHTGVEKAVNPKPSARRTPLSESELFRGHFDETLR